MMECITMRVSMHCRKHPSTFSLQYVFSDTKIMWRESAGVWHSFSM